MIFSSVPFIFYFLVIFFILYYILPFKLKNYCLLVFSLIFYAWGEPIYIVLMLFTTLIDYINGRILEKNPKQKKFYLVFAIMINLALLGFFKYADFLIASINQLFNLQLETLNLPLPVGISFYTFQSMSYSIDVYKGKAKVEHNYFYYLMYVSMFPQLVAGPIVRYETISQQIYKRDINFENFVDGGFRFVIGLIKKVLLANVLGQLFNSITSLSDISLASAWLGLIAYALQLFFDFSGYSDMAIGLGRMMGFDYLENFNYPYIADSITDFWRRWHISLSTWFRDYIYIPLGGNRVNTFKQICNLLIVWLVTGIWHGAALNFILWGLYYGILLLIEKFILKNVLRKLPKFVCRIYALFFILIGWCIFVFEDTTQLLNYIKLLFNFNNLYDNYFLYYLKNYAVNLVIGILASTPLLKYICLKNKSAIMQALIGAIVILLFVVCISYMISNSYNPFLYFRF